MKTLYHDVNEELQREITVLPGKIRPNSEITMAMINILWVRLNLVTKANSACSKEYASTSHDLFF